MKRCPKNHDNPDNAKFCRICGYSFANSFSSQFNIFFNRINTYVSHLFIKMTDKCKELFARWKRPSRFTPDMFPSINLLPCSVVKVDFDLRKRMIQIVLLIALFAALIRFKYTVIFFLHSIVVTEDLADWIVSAITVIVGLLFLFKFFPFLRRLWKWAKYKNNADYFEATAFMQNLYRIAKDGRLGLFDKSKKSVIKRSRYNNISRFNLDHILMEKKGKKGLYSIKKKKFIVPIRFSYIEPFKNSIVKCHNGTEVCYYDVNGNKME